MNCFFPRNTSLNGSFMLHHCGLFWTSQAVRGALMWCGVFALLFTSYRAATYTKSYSQNLKPKALIYCKTTWQALRLQIVSFWCGCLCTLSEKWLPSFVPKTILFHVNCIVMNSIVSILHLYLLPWLLYQLYPHTHFNWHGNLHL